MENLSQNIAKMFTESSQKNIEDILHSNISVPYFYSLQKAIQSQDHNALGSLVANGLAQIADREDNILGDYFFVLSEIQGIPNDIRSYLMDVMLWCEENETYRSEQTWKNAEELKNYFEQHILPLLEKYPPF